MPFSNAWHERRARRLTPSRPPLVRSPCAEWNFDGSSTGQAPGHDSDVYLRPVAIFKDPFRKGDNILVLCETYNNDGTPNSANHRHHANKVMQAVKAVSGRFPSALRPRTQALTFLSPLPFASTSPGSASSRSTRSSTLTDGRSSGPRVATPRPRDPTTVVSEPAASSPAT